MTSVSNIARLEADADSDNVISPEAHELWAMEKLVEDFCKEIEKKSKQAAGFLKTMRQDLTTINTDFHHQTLTKRFDVRIAFRYPMLGRNGQKDILNRIVQALLYVSNDDQEKVIEYFAKIHGRVSAMQID